MSNDAFIIDDSGTRDSTSKIARVRPELNFSQCMPVNKDDELIPFEYSVSEDDTIYNVRRVSQSSVDFQISLKKLLKKINPDTARIIELVYFEDYSIKDAAKEVGLSGWAASMRLKKLASKQSFKDFFDKLER